MRWYNLGWWQGYLPRRINPIRRQAKYRSRQRHRERMARQAEQLRAARLAHQAGTWNPRQHVLTPAMQRSRNMPEHQAPPEHEPVQARRNEVRMAHYHLPRGQRRALDQLYLQETGRRGGNFKRRHRAAIRQMEATSWA
jgi:hypothetical protein